MQILHDCIDYSLRQNPLEEINPDEVAKSPRSSNSKEQPEREIRVITTSNQTEVIGL